MRAREAGKREAGAIVQAKITTPHYRTRAFVDGLTNAEAVLGAFAQSRNAGILLPPKLLVLHLPLRIRNRRNIEHFGMHLAIFAPVPDFTVPLAVATQGGPHVLVKIRRLMA